MIVPVLRSVLLVLVMLTCDPAPAAPREAGFEHTRLPDGAELGVWYPAHGRPVRQTIGPRAQETVPGAAPAGGGLPLVVISHGTGGSFADHLDTASALARAGFVVASVTHPGDNWQDRSRSTAVEARPAELRAVIGFMLAGWSHHRVIDPDRVGAFGFSSGGFTVLAAAGGVPDLTRMVAHCAAHPDFVDCQMIASHPHALAAWPANLRDHRLRALVVAAPALGFSFRTDGLRAVDMPVQLWRADDDQILPAPFYADAVRAALPHPPEFHGVPGAGHLDFLAPCAPEFALEPICASAPGFDRAAFHERFNAAVVGFFAHALAPAPR